MGSVTQLIIQRFQCSMLEGRGLYCFICQKHRLMLDNVIYRVIESSNGLDWEGP